MCGILGIVARSPVNQLLYDGLAAPAAPRPGRRGHRHQRAQLLPHAQGRRHGARRVPHARHALAAGQPRHRPLPLPDRRLGVQGRRGAAVLRQLAVRHRPRPQRQPDQLRAAEGRDVPHRPAAHQHRLGLGGAGQRPRARARAGRGQAASRARGHLRRGGERPPARARRLRGGGDDRRLRRAGVPRPVRHPPAGDRLQRDRRRAPSTWWLPSRSRSTRSASACCATSRPGEAVFIDEDGKFHSQPVRAERRASIPASSSTSTWRGPTR